MILTALHTSAPEYVPHLEGEGRLGTIHKHQAGNGKIKFFPPTDFCLITSTPTCGVQFNRFVVDFMQYTTFNNQSLDLKPFISLWLNTTFLLRGQLNRHGSWKLFHAARVITTHNLQNKTSNPRTPNIFGWKF